MGFKTKNELITDMPLGYQIRDFIDSVYDGAASIEAFGAKGDGETDDTPAIQAAIDTVAAAGGGTVFVPPSAFAYIVQGLQMKSKVRFSGSGLGSQLALPASATGSIFTLADGNVELTTIENLYLFGDRSNQSNAAAKGIAYDNTGYTTQTTSTPRHTFRNLLLKDFYGNGVETAAASGNNLAHNVHCYQIRGNAFQWDSFDSVLAECWVTTTLGDAYNLGGGNQKVIGCKSGFAGRLGSGSTTAIGFNLTGNRIQVIGCEAQNGNAEGFEIKDANMVDLIGCHADANGQGAVAAGFKLDNADECNLVGCKAGDLQEDSNPIEQDYALEMVNNPTRNYIQIMVKETKTGVRTGTDGTDNRIDIVSSTDKGLYGTFQSNILMKLFRAASTNTIFEFAQDGDSNARLAIRADGRMTWGTGSAGGDTVLFRSASNILKTDDKFVAQTGIGVGNSASATTPGSVTDKIEVFDGNGASLGFLAVYDAIT